MPTICNEFVGRKDRPNLNKSRKPSKWAFIIMQEGKPFYATLYYDSARDIIVSHAIPNAEIVRLENKACRYLTFTNTSGEYRPLHWSHSYKEVHARTRDLGECDHHRTLRIMSRGEANALIFEGDGTRTRNRALERYERSKAH